VASVCGSIRANSIIFTSIRSKSLTTCATISRGNVSSETTVYDRSPYGNDGTCNGVDSNYGCNWTNSAEVVAITGGGRYGNAMFFDGTDDYINIPDDANLNPGTGLFSIELWAKYKGGQANAVRLVSKVFTTGYALMINLDGSIRLEVKGNAQGVSTPDDYDDDKWHHIVAVRTGDTTAKIYVDGIEKVSGSVVGGGCY